MNAMNAISVRRQRGFSLIELSVALVVTGLLGLLVWRWILAVQEPATVEKIQQQLSEAQAAVEGFVLANHRLPCPAVAATGAEACSNPAAVALPWRALGLSSGMGQLHYGVNRGGGADLAALPAPTVSPDLNFDFVGIPLSSPPVSNTSATAAIDAASQAVTLIAAANSRRSQVNGLDWCQVLRSYSVNPSAPGVLQAGNVTVSLPVAYILVHAGQNGQFDGNNTLGVGGSFKYDLPGREQDAQYDDVARAVGPADLSARLGCVARLSAAMAAAQAAFAQYDAARVMQAYWSLRAFDVKNSETNLARTTAKLALATLDLALSSTKSFISIASALNTEGLTAPTVIVAAASVVVATAKLAAAIKGVVEAGLGLEASITKLDATSVYAAETYKLLSKSLQQAILLDQKGLNP